MKTIDENKDIILLSEISINRTECKAWIDNNIHTKQWDIIIHCKNYGMDE